MGDFFKGWRRKTGMVTLVMACLFMISWVRSCCIVDVVMLNNQMILTSGGSLIWDRPPSTWVKGGDRTRWSSDALTPVFSYFTSQHDKLKSEFDWHFELSGFGRGEYLQNGILHLFLAVPHWFVILVLTLIASRLILTKQQT